MSKTDRQATIDHTGSYSPEFVVESLYGEINVELNFSYDGIFTLYKVCSVHRGMFSTSGGVQYIGGCSVHRGDTMSTSGEYHEYIGIRRIS